MRIARTAIAVIGAMVLSNIVFAGSSNPPPPQPITCGAGDAVTSFSYGTLPTCGTPIAGGTINAGTAGQLTDYSAATTVSPITTGTGVVTALGVNIGSAGAVVVNGGALGTPSSGTLTSATGLPIATGVSGLGTGVATFLATPSSANLAAAITNETGSGALVFGTAPTIAGGALSGTFTGTPTLSGNLTFSGDPIFSGVPDGTIASGKNLGLDSSNNLVKATVTGSGSVSVTAGTPDIVVTPSPGTGTFTVGTTVPQNSPADGGSHSYTILSGDLTKQVILASTFTGAAVPQATGSFAAGSSFTMTNKGAITATSTTSTINGIAGATGVLLGANTTTSWVSDGTNWLVATGVPTKASQGAATFLRDDGAWAAPSGAGTVTNSANLTNNAIILGDGGTTGIKSTTTGTGVVTALAANLSANGGLTKTVFSGAKALATGAISSAACTSAQTDTATGTLTTDVIHATFNGDPTAVTGYVPLTTGMLTIIAYPTADTVNFKVCNNTSASITPGAITLNWRVLR